MVKARYLWSWRADVLQSLAAPNQRGRPVLTKNAPKHDAVSLQLDIGDLDLQQGSSCNRLILSLWRSIAIFLGPLLSMRLRLNFRFQRWPCFRAREWTSRFLGLNSLLLVERIGGVLHRPLVLEPDLIERLVWCSCHGSFGFEKATDFLPFTGFALQSGSCLGCCRFGRGYLLCLRHGSMRLDHPRAAQSDADQTPVDVVLRACGGQYRRRWKRRNLGIDRTRGL